MDATTGPWRFRNRRLRRRLFIGVARGLGAYATVQGLHRHVGFAGQLCRGAAIVDAFAGVIAAAATTNAAVGAAV